MILGQLGSKWKSQKTTGYAIVNKRVIDLFVMGHIKGSSFKRPLQ